MSPIMLPEIILDAQASVHIPTWQQWAEAEFLNFSVDKACTSYFSTILTAPYWAYTPDFFIACLSPIHLNFLPLRLDVKIASQASVAKWHNANK